VVCSAIVIDGTGWSVQPIRSRSADLRSDARVGAGSLTAMTNFRTRGLLISALVAGLLTVTACGSSSGSGGSSGSDGASSGTAAAGALTVYAEDIHFDKKAYDATPVDGKVTVDYKSKGQLVHSLVIYDKNNKVVGETLRVNPGKTDTGTFDLPAGTYTMICDIPGHREAGMTATLTVK
jgi:plastocyanin